MATFAYTARKQSGERMSGTLEATDRRAATLQIEAMGCMPVSIEERKAGESRPKPLKQARPSAARGADRRMRGRDMLVFTTELSDLLGSGMNLGHALSTLARRRVEKAGGAVVKDLRDEIIRGTSLSDALRRHPRTFPALYVSMIRAGEASGALGEVMVRLVAHYERVQEVKEKVITALVYPLIVMTVGIATIIFLMVFVVPRFSVIFQELGSSLPLPTRMLIWTSEAFVRYWVVVVAAIAGVAFLISRLFKMERGLFLWHSLQLRIPLVRGIVAANAFARFARTLGILLGNGVPVLRALGITEDTVGNAVLAKEIRNARDRVTDGATISGPLAAGRIFPPMMTDMLAVGEESGDITGALGHIARRYESDVDRNIKIFTTALEPILMVVIAVFVGFVAVSLLLAVFDMTSGLTI